MAHLTIDCARSVASTGVLYHGEMKYDALLLARRVSDFDLVHYLVVCPSGGTMGKCVLSHDSARTTNIALVR